VDSEKVKGEKDLLAEDLKAMTLLQTIGALFLREGELQGVLEQILEAAIEITHAEMGAIEFFDRKSGRVKKIVRHGAEMSCPRFLHQRDGEKEGGWIATLKKGERIIIEDVVHTPSFIEAPLQKALTAAGVSALQVTPIVRQEGGMLGVFSTCYKPPFSLDDRKLQFLDLLARQMASSIVRFQAEEALRESEQRFRVLSEAVPQIVWASDSEGRADYYNTRWSAYTGQTFEEAKGLGWLAAVHPEDLPRAQGQWTYAVRSGTQYEVEYRVRGKDGRYRWFLSRGLPQRDSEGRINHWFGTCTDITEHKVLEETLETAKRAAEEANRAKSEFLANMSHEIRTPMTVFMAAIEHLLLIDTDPEHRQLLEMADNSAQRLHTLLDDILDFSRIEARRIDIEEEPFVLRGCIRRAAEMLEINARKKNLRLETQISPEIPSEVVGDENRIGQVLINLIGNAVKFTSHGEVRVSVHVAEDLLHFAVSDTGIGIPEEKRDLLFQTFRQIDSSLTRKYGGTGLGLAISKGLVELMGGEIGVMGREGGGSVFYFTLPLKRPETPRFAASEGCKETRNAGIGPLRILLAEDDPMVSEVIRNLLDQRGWQIETAATGSEALTKWRNKRFDLILMDLHMPEMNGLEAARKIRELEKDAGGHTCIVGLTADARRETRNTFLLANLDGFLTKPVRMDDLYAAIEKCISA
jgi:PAS domain S-box-containing protein